MLYIGADIPEWTTLIVAVPMFIGALLAAIYSGITAAASATTAAASTAAAAAAAAPVATAAIVGGTAATGKSIAHGAKTGDWAWDDPVTHAAIMAGGVPVVGPALSAGVQELGGRDPDWGKAAVSTGINAATMAAGGLAPAASSTQQVAGTAAQQAAGTVTQQAGQSIAKLAAANPGTQGLQTLAEGAASGNTGMMAQALEATGEASTLWDDVQQAGDWVGENVMSPIRSVTHAPDSILTPYIGETAAGVVGGGIRGAAIGASRDPNNAGRGAAMGVAGGVTTSALRGALGSVLPKRIDVTDTFTRNPAFSVSNPLNESSAGTAPYIIGNSLRPENVGASGRFGPTRGMQMANAGIKTGVGLAGNLASHFTGDALTPKLRTPNRFRSRNISDINRANGMYRSPSPFTSRKYI